MRDTLDFMQRHDRLNSQDSRWDSEHKAYQEARLYEERNRSGARKARAAPAKPLSLPTIAGQGVG